jgi:hypothetical protein
MKVVEKHRKIEKKIKRHERNAPLKQVLKVEGVGEESEKVIGFEK